jgi:hypothetical protein
VENKRTYGSRLAQERPLSPKHNQSKCKALNSNPSITKNKNRLKEIV